MLREFSPAEKDNAPIIEETPELRDPKKPLCLVIKFRRSLFSHEDGGFSGRSYQVSKRFASKAKPAAKKDMEELLKFAKDDLKLEDPRRDLTYASERLREKKIFLQRSGS